MSFQAARRRRVKKEVGEKSLTKQEFRDQCDVNRIMDKYQKTGLLDHVSRYQGQYGDFADAPDYHTALNKMYEADAMFMTVPSSIREMFNNDAGEFLEFVMDPANEAEMREIGLLPKKSANEVQDPPEPLPRGERASGGSKKSPPGAAQAKRGSEEGEPSSEG